MAFDDRKHAPYWAPIEELDPEPPARARRGPRWERVLGLLLVLGLVGFGSWQWWQDSMLLGAYHAGQRAGAAHDWAAAQAAYLAAGGYADARQQAAVAAGKLVERDRQYALATAAAARGDWPAVLQAVQHLRRVVPDYRDSARLARQALGPVYAAALSGTVALRTAASPPGLYSYRGGWHWLPASDIRSQVLATCTNGDLLYDVPDPAGPPAGAPLPGPGAFDPRNGPGRLLGRHLRVSHPDGILRASLALVPTEFQAYVCSDLGVWGERGGPALGGLAPPPPAPLRYGVTYQAFDTSQPVVVAPPGGQGAVLSIAPAVGRLLLLSDTTSLDGRAWHSRISLAGADGRGPRLLLDGPVQAVGADLSPDGRWAFLSVAVRAPPGDAFTTTLLLLDTAGAAPPRPLAAVYHPGAEIRPLLDPIGFFLRQGPHAGSAVVTWIAADQRLVLLVDPAGADQPLAAWPAGAPDRLPRILPGVPQDGLLLVESSIGPGRLTGASRVLYLDPAGLLHLFQGAAGTSFIRSAAVRAGRLAYVTTAFNLGQIQYTVHSLPLAQLATPGAAIAVYSGPSPRTSNRFRALPWHFGAGLLAYLAPSGELHARSYDGMVDVLLPDRLADFRDPPTP
ncbi:MAG TPA: hypothetical protein VKY74_18270 [Chloroflexia bacterium]|nr:hypothetical protein [Chloroflexia bacterium]